ncbi:hypothetical protein KCU65_g152, partial [Aureobasidium melanogenum]
MADTNPAAKHPPKATVEDCAESDDEKGDSSASKPASNSKYKRIRKTSDPKRSSPSKARPASDTGPPEAPPPPVDTDAPSRQPEEPASRAGAKEEVSSEPGASKPRRSRRPSEAPAPSSPDVFLMSLLVHAETTSSWPFSGHSPWSTTWCHTPRTHATAWSEDSVSTWSRFSRRSSSTSTDDAQHVCSFWCLHATILAWRRRTAATHEIANEACDPSSREIKDLDLIAKVYHFSARNLPLKPQHVPGGFESDSYSSESPLDSPEYFEQPRRPAALHRATTSAVQQINRSGHTRSRSDYPAESAYGYHRTYPSEPAWDQNIYAGHSDYGDQRSCPGGRRGSNATTWTQHTSASDPQRPSYVHYNQYNFHNGHPDHEHSAIEYMNQARGHPEERITAEALRQLPGGPGSTRSNHSHRRSRHSMSETSSRHRGAEGSVKVILPIAAADDTRIQLSGDMGDREVSLRSTNDPGMVEVTIATVAGGESRYLKSASQTSRAPTRSSGSTRHATRGGAEGQEQGREYREHRERRERRHSSPSGFWFFSTA